MAAVAANLSAQFIMAVGDNFYSTGIHGDDHAQRFVDTFEKCYTEDALDLPWYALAGNHDHHGNVSAQIAYTHDQSRWTFPDYWYTFNRTAAGVTTQVIMIDTVTLCGMAYMDEATGEVVSGEAHPMQARAGEQLAWIEATLKASTADYVWLSGHYPVYSQCQHGPTACLISQVLPLMRQYGASGFIAGHDHCLGHYNGVGADAGMAFVLSGAGKECCYRPRLAVEQAERRRPQVPDGQGGEPGRERRLRRAHRHRRRHHRHVLRHRRQGAVHLRPRRAALEALSAL